MVEIQIRQTLEALDAGIKAVDSAIILHETARLDALVAEHGDKLDPRLAHFLKQRSYTKARRLLGVEGPGPKVEGRNSEIGSQKPEA